MPLKNRLMGALQQQAEPPVPGPEAIEEYGAATKPRAIASDAERKDVSSGIVPIPVPVARGAATAEEPRQGQRPWFQLHSQGTRNRLIPKERYRLQAGSDRRPAELGPSPPRSGLTGSTTPIVFAHWARGKPGREDGCGGKEGHRQERRPTTTMG